MAYKLRGEPYPEEYVALHDIKEGSVFTRHDYLPPAEVRIIRAVYEADGNYRRAAVISRLTEASLKATLSVIYAKINVHSLSELLTWSVKRGIFKSGTIATNMEVNNGHVG